MKTFIKLLPIIAMTAMVSTGIDILLAASVNFFFAAILCMIFEKLSTTEVIAVGIHQRARRAGQGAETQLIRSRYTHAIRIIDDDSLWRDSHE